MANKPVVLRTVPHSPRAAEECGGRDGRGVSVAPPTGKFHVQMLLQR